MRAEELVKICDAKGIDLTKQGGRSTALKSEEWSVDDVAFLTQGVERLDLIAFMRKICGFKGQLPELLRRLVREVVSVRDHDPKNWPIMLNNGPFYVEELSYMVLVEMRAGGRIGVHDWKGRQFNLSETEFNQKLGFQYRAIQTIYDNWCNNASAIINENIRNCLRDLTGETETA